MYRLATIHKLQPDDRWTQYRETSATVTWVG